MELYILRHGIAEEGGPGMPDEDRQLTSEGRLKLQSLLRAVSRARVRPTLILTSPYVRAVQTAEIAAAELGCKSDLVHTYALVPEADPHELWTEIRTHRDESSILVASHNPLCSRLPGFFLGTPGLLVDFGKGNMVGLTVDRFGPEPRGVLQWMLRPRFA